MYRTFGSTGSPATPAIRPAVGPGTPTNFPKLAFVVIPVGPTAVQDTEFRGIDVDNRVRSSRKSRLSRARTFLAFEEAPADVFEMPNNLRGTQVRLMVMRLR